MGQPARQAVVGAAALPPPMGPAPLVRPNVQAVPSSRGLERQQAAHSMAASGLLERRSGDYADAPRHEAAHNAPESGWGGRLRQRLPPMIGRVLSPSQGPAPRQPGPMDGATAGPVPVPPRVPRV